MKIERRAGLAEIRAVTDAGGKPGVTLHCIKPGIVDDYGTLWMPDAFDESLAERMPTLCWSHSWSEPLGPATAFRVSSDGPDVDFVFSDFDAVPTARRAYAQLQDGTIQDCSVGFSDTQRRSPTDEEKKQYPGIYEVIEKATLDEVSLVLRGAVAGAKVLAVRSGQVPEEVVLEYARRVSEKEITHEQASEAIRLIAEAGAPVETPDAAAIAATRWAAALAETRQLLGTEAPDTDEDPGLVAQAIDAVIDELLDALASGEIDQATALAGAADIAVDALLELLGVVDADDIDVEPGPTGTASPPTPVIGRSAEELAAEQRDLDAAEQRVTAGLRR